MPADQAQYIHRVGRTARAGKQGQAILLLHDFERFFLQSIRELPVEMLQPTPAQVSPAACHAAPDSQRYSKSRGKGFKCRAVPSAMLHSDSHAAARVGVKTLSAEQFCLPCCIRLTCCSKSCGVKTSSAVQSCLQCCIRLGHATASPLVPCLHKCSCQIAVSGDLLSKAMAKWLSITCLRISSSTCSIAPTCCGTERVLQQGYHGMHCIADVTPACLAAGASTV